MAPSKDETILHDLYDCTFVPFISVIKTRFCSYSKKPNDKFPQEIAVTGTVKEIKKSVPNY